MAGLVLAHKQALAALMEDLAWRGDPALMEDPGWLEGPALE